MGASFEKRTSLQLVLLAFEEIVRSACRARFTRFKPKEFVEKRHPSFHSNLSSLFSSRNELIIRSTDTFSREYNINIKENRKIKHRRMRKFRSRRSFVPKNCNPTIGTLRNERYYSWRNGKFARDVAAVGRR